MEKLKYLLFLFFAIVLFAVNLIAQTPEKFSYQAVVRDESGLLITNQKIGLKISILQGNIEGAEIYSEIQTPTSNTNGLISIDVGAGTYFNQIDWTDGPYFIKTEIDPDGGTNYSITGISQMLSVPYALHAKTAETLTDIIDVIETDPIFQNSPAADIETSDITNWNETHAWGNHAEEGYLKESVLDYINELENKLNALLAYLEINKNKPLVSSLEINEITPTTAIGGGNVHNFGGSDIIARGLVWHTVNNPCIENNLDFTTEGSGFGEFVSTISGLNPQTEYYVRAYATNDSGTSYGKELTFQTIHCDDGDLCTTGYFDHLTGECIYEPINCDDGNPCTDNTCDPAIGCVSTNNNAPCDDGNACTTNNICVDGVCTGTPIECDDGDPCTTNTCDPAIGCVYTPIPDCIPCNNNEDCPDGKECIDGRCQ